MFGECSSAVKITKITLLQSLPPRISKSYRKEMHYKHLLIGNVLMQFGANDSLNEGNTQ
jgi:hypothetical protein